VRSGDYIGKGGTKKKKKRKKIEIKNKEKKGNGGSLAYFMPKVSSLLYFFNPRRARYNV